MSLSDEIIDEKFMPSILEVEDVKEFIRELKEIITDNGNTFGACTLRHSAEEIMKVHNELTRIIFQIDKLAGDKLI